MIVLIVRLVLLLVMVVCVFHAITSPSYRTDTPYC
jgi:hypothetical protein